MFQRMYADEPDNWQEVTEEEIRKRLDGYYTNIDEVIDAVRNGAPIRTPFAFFRFVDAQA